jgi:hypothetical protein
MAEPLDLASDPPPQHMPASTARQPTELEKAYRRCHYRVDLPGTSLVIRIDEPQAVLDALLTQHGCLTWALVTAYNPASILLPLGENKLRQARLQEEVRAAGWVCYPGEGMGTDGWPGEESFLLLGIDRDSALALARRHGQLALVFGQLGEIAELLWTGEATDGVG